MFVAHIDAFHQFRFPADIPQLKMVANLSAKAVVVLVQSFDSSSYQYVREGVSNTVSVSIKG